MRRELLNILACPSDGHYPLKLYVFDEQGEIVDGIIVCPNCLRWYPIHESIPEMLPDELRDELEEMLFMEKWKDIFPKYVHLKKDLTPKKTNKCLKK